MGILEDGARPSIGFDLEHPAGQQRSTLGGDGPGVGTSGRFTRNQELVKGSAGRRQRALAGGERGWGHLGGHQARRPGAHRSSYREGSSHGPADGLPCDPEDVYVDRHNRLWVPTACGLFRNDRPAVSNRFVRLDTPESLTRSALKILEDAQGTIWVVNPDALWSLRDGQWREHRRAEGLLTDSPYAMALAADGSIWLRHRYDAGVDRMEVSGDRIVRVTAIVPGDPKSV